MDRPVTIEQRKKTNIMQALLERRNRKVTQVEVVDRF